MGQKMTKSNQSYLIIIYGLMLRMVISLNFFSEILKLWKFWLMTPATAVTIPKSES